MSSEEEKTSPIDKESILAKLFQNDDTLWANVLDSDESFQELTRLETLLSLASQSSLDTILLDSSDSVLQFQEDLDIAKADFSMQSPMQKPLPDFLKRYTDSNLNKPERKQTLLVRLTESGIQLFDSIKEGLSFSSRFELSPDMRSSATLSSDLNSVGAGFVVFEEKVQNGQKFFYQMVRETQNEVYLSIKMDEIDSGKKFNQVILRKEGRFIQSNRINSEGVVNFSSLSEGDYSVEFLGLGENKIVDLYLIVD
jgi:hypothetical protein